MYFAVLADHRIKLKDIDNRDKYFDFARELKEPCDMRVTEIQIEINALCTNPQEIGAGTGGLGN